MGTEHFAERFGLFIILALGEAGLLIVVMVAVIGSSHLALSRAEAEGEVPVLRKG